MHFTKKNHSEKRVELKDKLKKQKILRFPGAYNPLTAKLIAEIERMLLRKILVVYLFLFHYPSKIL